MAGTNNNKLRRERKYLSSHNGSTFRKIPLIIPLISAPTGRNPAKSAKARGAIGELTTFEFQVNDAELVTRNLELAKIRVSNLSFLPIK